MTDDSIGLPVELGEGLVLRWGSPDDAEELAQFNVRWHSDNPEEPQEFIAHWTRALMRGDHPTIQASDFTVVVDQSKDNRIVSSVLLISQTWAYDGIEFGCGRPELIATHPEYRRRGLVRRQMEAVHAKSETRGELVQAITGVPWFYRMFGYEMALNLHGGRAFFWSQPENSKSVSAERYYLRSACDADIPTLAALYREHCDDSLVTCVRDEHIWRYEMEVARQESEIGRNLLVVETEEREIVAYVEYQFWGDRCHVRELGVRAGHSWRDVCLFLTRALRARSEVQSRGRKKPIDHIHFGLGETHRAYDALGRQLEKAQSPYAWYIRVADLPGFLMHIAPVLRIRLAESVMAGYSGTIRLNSFVDRHTLVFSNGTLEKVGTYESARVSDGDAFFPELTFLQLLFGRRSFEELDYARPDCYAANAETAVLLDILFPRRPSNLIPLS